MHFCIFTSLHMLDFHVFILACPTKLYTYKFPICRNCRLQITKLKFRQPTHDQVCKFIGLQVYKIKTFTNCKCMFASSQVCKYAKLPNYQLQNYKLEVYKLHVHIFKFQIYKIKASQFKIFFKKN